MADHDGDGECQTGGEGQGDIPSGVVVAGVEIAIESIPDGGLEEEEVDVGEEEGNWPAFKKAIEMGWWDEGQPRDCRKYDDNLLGETSFLLGILAEAVEAVDREGDGENPRPKEPCPAEIHPEEGV